MNGDHDHIAAILNDYLMNYSNIPVIMLAPDDRITGISQGFKKIVREDCQLKDKQLSEVLELNKEGEYTRHGAYEKATISCIYNPSDGVQTTLKGSILKHHKGKVIIFENTMITASGIIEQMSQMNIEMSNLTRELAKKNRELESAYTQITELSRLDYLTNIYNRKHFFSRLDEMISLSNRVDSLKFGVIMLDIDHFKQVNDVYGHDMGDTVLKKLSNEIKSNIRKEDVFARIGGEEFAILARVGNAESLVFLAEKLRICCERCEFSDMDHGITVSFGATLYRKPESVTSLMKRVDQALYHAKDQGRNRVVLY